MVPRPEEVKIGQDGTIKRGVSFNIDPKKVEKFGVPCKVICLPEDIVLKQIGSDLSHFEAISTRSMSFSEYAEVLVKRLKLLIPK